MIPQPGDHVRLDAYGGPIVRRVVEVTDDLLMITRDEEWEAAKREDRDPLVVGFKREYLIEIVDRPDD